MDTSEFQTQATCTGNLDSCYPFFSPTIEPAPGNTHGDERAPARPPPRESPNADVAHLPRRVAAPRSFVFQRGG
jgi:hypothetical protein